MAGDLRLVSELAGKTAEKITQDKENWKRFLDVAAKVNMYDFDEQLLIYAQRPKATACATLEQWNNSMNRWVRGGSKGIALIHRNAMGQPYLSYVFDVNDTRPIRGAKLPYVWKVEESNKAEVLTALEERFGKAEGNAFHEKLTAAAGAAVREWYGERGVSENGEKDSFQDILTASVEYMLLARCNMTEAFTDDGALEKIRDFADPDTLYHLGDAVSSISRDILLEIRKTIRRIDLEVSKERAEKTENTLDPSGGERYNKDNRKFNTLIRENVGGEENGRTDIQKRRRVSDTQPDPRRGGTDGDDREVRPAAGALPAGPPARGLHRNAPDGHADTASSRDRYAGGGRGGASGAGNDEGAGRGRSAESGRPDAVGTEGQRTDGNGRGDGASGDRLSVSSKQRGLADTDRAGTAGGKPAVPASGAGGSEREGKFTQLSLFPTTKEQAADIAPKQEKKAIHAAEMELSSVTKRLAGNIYAFYYAAGQKPGGFDWNPERGEQEFRPLLGDKKYLEGLYQDMAEVFAKLPADGSFGQYHVLKETLADVDAFRKGEYSLYKPRPGSAPAEEKTEGQRTEQEKAVPQREADKDGADGNTAADTAEKTLSGEVTGKPPGKKHDFRISDGPFQNPKTRYQRNVAAIRLLKQIEADGRLALPGEQEVLSRYTGWGGLTQAFDPGNKEWTGAYGELKGLLTEKEYEAARSSILSAYYTSPTLIGAVYEAVERMGIVPESVLEPACGVGNYFGLLPEKFGNARLYGVEPDSISGRIAKQLYQNADISLCGFEETMFSDDSFDLAVGNVPFGEYGVHDKRYDREGLLIHDYILVKTLDKLKPGGIAAMITTRGTMDKGNPAARELMAQKAELLGALRLPNNAFSHSGTEVTTDILFFRKLDGAPVQMPEWTKTETVSEGIRINSYFAAHPEMVLGEMGITTTRYGQDITCRALKGADFKAGLAEAVKRIGVPVGKLPLAERAEEKELQEDIPTDGQARNYSFLKKDGKLYFCENSHMRLVETGKTQTGRIAGMIEIRDCTRKLIELQMQGADDETVEAQQRRLNTLYDNFTKQYGLLNSTGNRLVFRQDASYPLLCSLEILDEEGKFERKADMFTKRTIQYRKPVTHADTAVEALGISIGERACVDLGFMASLMGGAEKIPQIVSDLTGIIFKDPESGSFDPDTEQTDWYKGWQTADEYLSGNVRKKLDTARKAAKTDPAFSVNVDALTKVQPKDLTAAEISVRLGAPWVDMKYYRQFMYGLFQTPERYRNEKMIDIKYSDVSGEWYVGGKSMDGHNSLAERTYGTKRINGYAILEAALNQRSVQIYDTKKDEDGKEIRVLNQKETIIAQQKQDALKEAFQNWIFQDAERRTDLCGTYNRLYNAVVPRSYDGSHIFFAGMNPEIALEEHQKNAVARILYGGNTLLAHVVGAGKTFEMAAAAMESKRLGLCRKSMFVVPNHLTGQWGVEFLRLYPTAKVLVTTDSDFETHNRKKFCARIATGDYDAVVIGHSQFEKIPISAERQKKVLEEQIREIVMALEESDKKESYMIRQLEQTKKHLEQNLKKLSDIEQDDTVTFEELGVDRLFVDEAHFYKNLFLYTKMRNVAGISQAAAKKSSDMFAKCRYMDEITGGKGIVFATGTPVSNSMVELYTMMRYLQYNMLEEGFEDSTGQKHSLLHFDNWAATFGEQVTAVELKPEGTGFRLKTRFAKFYNLPELMNLWKEAADIQTADMLNLPVPDAEYITIQTEPSEAQKKMVQALADRAERIRIEKIDPSIDNMLKVTSDGRKLALDQRIINPLLPDDPGSKVNACVGNVFRIWQETAEERSTQLIFSDLSTPKGKTEPKKNRAEGDGRSDRESEDTVDETALMSSVYEDIRDKLVAKGIPGEEIAFIHEARTKAKKAELFAKVRSGKVRVLLGSTQKMGAGTNVQKKLAAIHDLDCPWRPADLEQRAGRIVRRGNENKKVWIYRYVTKGTFDAYTWGLVEAKQKFIGQIMTSKSPVRSADDVDATALSYAEVKMLAAGDPRIKEKMDLDIQVTRLKLLKANHQSQQYEMQDKVKSYYPRKIKETELYIDCLEADLPRLHQYPVKEDQFQITVMGKTYTERKDAGEAVKQACRNVVHRDMEIDLGEFRGFPMRLGFDGLNFEVTMKGHLTYTAKLSEDILGNITRINNVLERIPQKLKEYREDLEQFKKELESAGQEAARPFPQEKELAEKTVRLAELNRQLEHDDKGRGKDNDPSAVMEDMVAEPVKVGRTEIRKESVKGKLAEYKAQAAAIYSAGAQKATGREAVL